MSDRPFDWSLHPDDPVVYERRVKDRLRAGRAQRGYVYDMEARRLVKRPSRRRLFGPVLAILGVLLVATQCTKSDGSAGPQHVKAEAPPTTVEVFGEGSGVEPLGVADAPADPGVLEALSQSSSDVFGGNGQVPDVLEKDSGFRFPKPQVSSPLPGFLTPEIKLPELPVSPFEAGAPW